MPNAIIPFCDATKPDVEARLEQHLAHIAVRGVRQIIGRSAEEDRKTGTSNLLSDGTFERGLKVLAARGLSFDLQLTPPLMKACADLFSKVPDLKVALCHAGSLSAFNKARLEEWETGLRALAGLPNLICKVSGFEMFNHNWTCETIEPHIHKVIEIFGPTRVAFGSNFPVDKLYASYEHTFGAYLSICERYDPIERDAMFRSVAEAFYRI